MRSLLRPSVLRGDKLLVAMSSNPDTTYEGFVHDVEETRVKLLFHSKLMTVATKAKIKFDVRFTINRFPQRTFHRLVFSLTASLSYPSSVYDYFALLTLQSASIARSQGLLESFLQVPLAIFFLLVCTAAVPSVGVKEGRGKHPT